MFEVVTELGGFFLFTFNHFTGQKAFFPQKIPQLTDQIGIFTKALHQDVLGTIERRFDISNTLFTLDTDGHKAFGFGFWRQRWIVVEGIGQWFETGFNSDLAFGATFRFIREIKILEAGFGIGLLDRLFQFRGQLVLFGNTFKNGVPTLFHLTKVAQALLKVTQLGIVQIVSYLLSVTGDKGNGCPLIQKLNGGGHLLFLNIQFRCNALKNTLHYLLSRVVRQMTNYTDGGRSSQPPLGGLPLLYNY